MAAANKIVVEVAAKDTSAGAFNKINKNLSEAEKHTKKLEAATDRLVKEIQFEGMVIGKTADEIKLMKLQQDGATASQLQAAKAAMTNRNELMKTGKQSGAFNGQMRLMRGGLGQVGHQVQDVAVQLQMGQNAMLVFGQQGSQVASLFGQRGALLGAIVAVGAAVATYMMPNMKKLSDVMNDVKSETEGLVDKFDTLSASLQAVAIRQAEKQHEALALAISKQKEKIAAVIKANDDLKGRNASAKKDAGELTILNQELSDSEAVLAHMKSELTKKTDNVTDATEDLIASLQDELTVINMSSEELATYNAEKAKATGTNKTLVESLYAQIEAEEKLKKHKEDTTEDLSKIEDSLKNKAELMFQAYAEEQQILDDALDLKLISQKKYDDLKAELDAKAMEDQKAMALTTASSLISMSESMVSSMSGLVDEGSAMGKAFFVISQTLAAADAIVKGYQTSAAITLAYASMSAQAAMVPGGQGVALGLLAAGKAHSSMAVGMGFATAGMIAGQTLASFEGGGLTGSGVRSGGMDGKGGMMAMLHPNEKVTDLHKGQGESKVVNVSFNIQANDTKGFDSLLSSRRGLIVSMINQAVNDRGRSSLA